MRYGASSWAWAYPFDSRTGIPLIERLARLGGTHFELGGEAVDAERQLDTSTLRRALGDYHMTASICGIFHEARDLASPDAEVRQAGRQHLEACLQAAEAIGAGVVVGAVAGTGGRTVLSSEERKRRVEFAAKELRRFGEQARTAGVKIGVEALNRYENNLVNTVAQAGMIVDLVDDPNVGLHVDLFHANIEESDLGDAIRLAGPKLIHCHAVDNTRGAPGTGHLPWAEIFKALADVAYDGALVIETFDPKNLEWATASAFWRPLAASQDELVQVGLSFLKSMTSARE